MTVPGPGSTAAELLAAYVPRTAVETADVERVRALVASGDPWSRAAPLHLTGSALIVHPADGRILLRWHERLGRWLQVGGHGEAGESDPLAVALREGGEESGLPDLAPWPDRRLVHVVIVPVPASAREPAHEHADLRFIFATGTPEAARPEKPKAQLRWLSPAQAHELAAEDNLRETLSRVVPLLESESESGTGAGSAGAGPAGLGAGAG
jgi:8-oxo-dGTP pyrophosphatase MutT (NUDIX family)